MNYLPLLVKSGLFYLICYTIGIIGKCIVAVIIACNKDLSDEKAKSITKMMSKDINIGKTKLS